METIINSLALFILLGSGFIAGVLGIFSLAIMPAFARIPASNGIRAMQSINKTIINPLFMFVFIGPALLSATFIILGLLGHLGENAPWFMAGSIAYLIGTFLVTVAGNVPMNEKLDTVEADSGDPYWQYYLKRWTRLNHFRALCALMACGLFALGFIFN